MIQQPLENTVTATITPLRPCPSCQHAELIANVSAALDPDRLANHVRAELRNWTPDDADAELIFYGPDYEVAVDVISGEVWEGDYTRAAEQQLRFALVHLAAALAAGAKL